MLKKVQVLQSVEREVVNPAHRVLYPAVNHLHKVLRDKDGERASLLREVVNPTHRVLSPTINHLHKVLREQDGESISVER